MVKKHVSIMYSYTETLRYVINDFPAWPPHNNCS